MSVTALAALLAVAAPPSKLAILPSVVAGAEAPPSAGQVFEACREGVGDRLDLDVLGYDEIFLRGATSRAHRAARCGSDAACLAEVLRDVGARAGLRTIVNFALEPPLVTVSWASSDPTVRPPAPELRQVGPEGWQRTVQRAVRELVSTRGHPPAGRVRVQTEPPGLAIELADPRMGRRAGPETLMMRPGRHVLRARGEDGRVAEAVVVVTANEAQTVVLRLPTRPAAEQESLTDKWWFWATIGAVAAGATTAAVVATQPFGGSPEPACVCITTPRGPCGTCP